jgi:hypothetical protein
MCGPSRPFGNSLDVAAWRARRDAAVSLEQSRDGVWGDRRSWQFGQGLCRLFGQVGKPLAVRKELTFENVRLAHLPERPSKLRAAYAFESAERLRRFQESTERTDEFACEAELVEPELPTHERA